MLNCETFLVPGNSLMPVVTHTWVQPVKRHPPFLTHTRPCTRCTWCLLHTFVMAWCGIDSVGHKVLHLQEEVSGSKPIAWTPAEMSRFPHVFTNVAWDLGTYLQLLYCLNSRVSMPWSALLPHRKKVPGVNPQGFQGLFYVEFAWWLCGFSLSP